MTRALTAEVPRSVPFARVDIVPAAQQAALQALRSGWITMGPQTSEFERELASYLGAGTWSRWHRDRSDRNGGAGAAASARRDGPHPEPDLLRGSGPISQAGLRPVLVDVAAGTLLPTPETVRRRGAPARGRPAAMIVQHMAGHPADVAMLAAAAGLPASAS